MGKKVAQLSELVTPAADHLVVISNDGITSKKIQYSNLVPLTSVNGQTGDAVLTLDDIAGGDDNVAFTEADKDKLDGISGIDISPFVTSADSHFWLKGQVYKGVIANYFNLIRDAYSQSGVRTLLDSAKRKGITTIRTWCFDPAVALRSLTYPLGTQLHLNPSVETDTTGFTLSAEFTRSNDTALDGTYAIKQVSDYNTYTWCSYQVTVLANTDYVWTMNYKGVTAPGASFQLPPVQWVGTTVNGSQVIDGGVISPSADWTQRQVKFNSGANTTVRLNIINFGGRNDYYYDKFHLGLAATPVLTYNEPVLKQIDFVLDEARKRGMHLILSLADGNENNYNTKAWYVTRANTIYGAGLSTSYPHIGFFTSTTVKDMYKDVPATLAERENTINGLIYKNDPAIFSWELGNELRTNRNDPSGINSASSANIALLSGPGGWADEMSTYIKTVDPNHMVGFGDMGHTWQYYASNAFGVDQDIVSNGSYYGVSYHIMIQNPNIDYLDFHIYPNQNNGTGFGYSSGGEIYGWGYRLGYPPVAHYQPSAAGFRAQIKDYIDVAHAAGKPVLCGEVGLEHFNATGNYPITSRYIFYKEFFKDFFDLVDGGDLVAPWSIVPGGTSSSFDIALDASGGEAVTDNTNDTTLVNLIKKYNDKLQFDILTSEGQVDPVFLRKQLEPQPANGGYDGIIEAGTAGTVLAFGELCYLNNNDSRWELADANDGDSYDKKLGICVLPADADGYPTKMLLMGKVRADNAFPTLIVGGAVYMSETTGAISSSKPTTTGAAHRVIGYGDTADQLYFQPDGRFHTVS